MDAMDADELKRAEQVARECGSLIIPPKPAQEPGIYLRPPERQIPGPGVPSQDCTLEFTAWEKLAVLGVLPEYGPGLVPAFRREWERRKALLEQKPQ